MVPQKKHDQCYRCGETFNNEDLHIAWPVPTVMLLMCNDCHEEWLYMLELQRTGEYELDISIEGPDDDIRVTLHRKGRAPR